MVDWWEEVNGERKDLDLMWQINDDDEEKGKEMMWSLVEERKKDRNMFVVVHWDRKVLAVVV